MKNGLKIMVTAVVVGLVQYSMADVLVPEWNGDAETTSAVYHFNTSANPPIPSALSNPYGTPSVAVDVGTEIGWQKDTFLNLDDTGCWFLSPAGFMEFSVPVYTTSPDVITLEIMIDIVSYQAPGLYVLPDITVGGDASPTDVMVSNELILNDTFFGGRWDHQTMTGTVELSANSSGTMDIRLDTSTEMAMSIQDVAIYTRAIPEPAAITLIIGASCSLLFVKRRFMVD